MIHLALAAALAVVETVRGDAAVVSREPARWVLDWRGPTESLVLVGPEGGRAEILEVESVAVAAPGADDGNRAPNDACRGWNDRIREAASFAPELRLPDTAPPCPHIRAAPKPGAGPLLSAEVVRAGPGRSLYAFRMGDFRTPKGKGKGKGWRHPVRVRLAFFPGWPHHGEGSSNGGIDLHVRTTGRVRVAASTLPPSWLDGSTPIDRLGLSTLAGPAAFHVVDADGDSLLGPLDALEFHGESGTERHSYERVYRLSRDQVPGSGLRMAAVDASGGPATLVTAPARKSFFQAARYVSIVKNGDKDNFFTALVNGSIPFSTTVDLPGYDGGPASLRIEVRGLTTNASVNPDHHLRASINGQTVGDDLFDGQVARSMTFDVPAGLLDGSGDSVVASVVADTGAAYDYQFIDGFEVTYPRSFTFASGENELLVEVPGGAVFEVVAPGTTGSIVAYDVSDPLRPRRQEIALDASSRGFAGFGGVASSTLRVLVSRAPAPPASLAPTRGSALLSSTAGADLVIVTSEELRPAADRLAARRIGEGLRVRVVEIADVFGAFSGGEPRPDAIRSLVAAAVSSWAAPAPRYLLLLGDGSYDYRADLPNAGLPANRQQVPVALMDTALGETASDNLFVDLDGDHRPELAVGRIPAASLLEAERAVDKILDYESASFDVDLATQTLFVTDNYDEEWERYYFETLTDDLRGRLPEYVDAPLVRLSETNPATARSRIVDAIDGGAVWVNYLGHGGPSVWAQENIFSTADIPALSNQGRLAFVAALTCANGAFHVPNVGPEGYSQRSLAEAMLVENDGGAVAFWGETSNSYPDVLPTLAPAAIALAFGGLDLRLGDVLLEAKRVSDASAFGAADLLDAMTHFGDPSMRLRTNRTPIARATPVDGPIPTGGWFELSAAASTDPDGQVLDVRWTILSSPPGSATELVDFGSDSALFWPDLPGNYLIALEVSDGLTWSAPAVVALTAEGPVQRPPRLAGGGCHMTGDAFPGEWSLALVPLLMLWWRRRAAST